MYRLLLALRNDEKLAAWQHQSLIIAALVLLAGAPPVQAAQTPAVLPAIGSQAQGRDVLPAPPVLPARLFAQAIVPAADGTGTQVNLNGNQFNINGGTLSGDRANLFHSFQRLGLNADQIANFMATPNLQNILGRVVGGDASVINGLIQVTGGNANLFLMNPAGIVFGPNARLDLAGAFTVTTAQGIKFGDQWFNAAGSNNYAALVGNPNAFAFTANQAGAIVNAGNLTVADGQALTLIGGTVVNTGNLTARSGQVTIAAIPGTNQVQINQDGVLLGLRVTPLGNTEPNPLPFTPATLPALLTGGNLPPTGVVVRPDGTVQLVAGGATIPTSAGTAIAAGTLDVSGQTGGNVGVFGDRVGVINGTVNASGTNGGGTVLIGGDYQGKGTVPNAQSTSVSQDSVIKADALDRGNGGQVIVWADGDTRFDGTVTARGGAQSGNGGLVETSGKQALTVGDRATVITTAAQGQTGTWLLDPADLTVVAMGGTGTITGGTNSVADSTINNLIVVTALNGTNVNLQATNSITVNAVIDASGNAAAGDLALSAPTANLNQPIGLRAGSTLSGTATTVNVGATGTVQNGVNVVATGGTVNLAAATYTLANTVNITKPLTLNGVSASSTTVSGNNAVRVFNIAGVGITVTLAGLTIANGNQISSSVGGGGLLNNLGSTLTLNDSIVQNNSSFLGGGGIRNDGTMVLNNVTVRDNTSNFSGFGGGIDNVFGGTLTLNNSRVTNNRGLRGGGIDNFSGSTLTINNSSISGNSAASGSGGGIYNESSNVVLNNSTLSGNSAASGSGIAKLGGTLSLSNSNLDDVLTTAGGTTALSGIITTTGAQTYNDAVTLGANTTLQGATVAFNSPVNAGSNALTLTADEINFNGTVTGTGNLTLQPLTPSHSIALGNPTDSSPGTLDLTTSDLNALQPGFSQITIGSANGTGTINVNSNVVFKDPTTLRTPGGDIAFNGSVTLQDDATLNLNSLNTTTTLNQNITSTTSTPLNFYGRVLLNGDITISSTSDIRFNNTLDGNNLLVLNAGSNTVQFNGTVGGTTPLKRLTIASQNTIVSSNISTNGDIQLNGAVIMTNNAGINSRAGSIRTTGTITGEGSPVNLVANGDIAIQDAIADQGISLASGATLTTRNLTTFGTAITVKARDRITTGTINSTAPMGMGNGGNVLLDPQGDIQVGFINAQGGATGVGGTVDITTAGFFRATGTFGDRNDILASISTAGGAGGGSITLRHGGGQTKTPFIIGDATTNGTAGAITSGAFTLAPVQAIRNSLTQGNIQILSTVDTDFTRNLVEPDPPDTLPEPGTGPEADAPDMTPDNVRIAAVEQSDGDRAVATLETDAKAEYESYFDRSETDTIQTVVDAHSTLQNIETETGIRPAIVYIAFAPSEVMAQTKRQDRSALSKSRDQLELILVTAKGQAIRKTIPGATRSGVQALANQFRDAITNPVRRRSIHYLLPPAKQLYRLFIAPLEAELKRQNIKNLAFVLDAGLRTLPIGALYDGETNSYLIEKYSLGLMPTLSLTDTRYGDVRKSQVLAMGAATFAKAQPAQGDLPAVPLELQLIEQQWGKRATKRLPEADFTLVKLRQQEPFGIIHLATHASFQAGPFSQSYIQFGDTALSLDKLRDLKWRSHPPELVVLSACRTAFGSAEAELGFAGSALQAGAKTVLASLWSVNDTGAAGLMAEFYHQLKTAPIKAEALRRAQIAMLRGDVSIAAGKLKWSGGEQALPPELAGLEPSNLSHPYFWSAFTLVGSPW